MLRSQKSLTLSLAGLAAFFFLNENVMADISGRVFRDFNANGLQDYRSSQEPGLGGITVSCTDASAGSDSTVSSIDPDTLGSYTLTGCKGDARVVFASTLPNDYSSTLSINDNTNVRFVKDGQTNLNYGVNYPVDYCPADPTVLVPAHYAGDGTGSNASLGSLYSFAASSTGRSDPATVAISKSQVGSVWGVAYDNTQQRVYLASYLKRHAGLKNGLGYIYIGSQDINTVSYKNSFDLQGVIPTNTGIPIDVGSVCRSSVCAKDTGNSGITSEYVIPPAPDTLQHDLDSFGKIGKVGLGALELTPDNRQLWAVNLYQRALIKLDATQTINAFPGAVEQYSIESLTGTPACSGGVLRPFGLTFYRDKGYLGTVCDASISKQASDLKAYVLSFDPKQIIDGFSTVASINLNYNRGGDTASAANSIWAYFQWHPWLDKWSDFKIPTDYTALYYAEPILSDITFTDDGGLNVSLMDRFGDQMGQNQYLPISNYYRAVEPRSFGDLIHFCLDSSGTYRIEGTAQCPTTHSYNTTLGVNNNGEFYEDMAGDGVKESTIGSAVYWRGAQKILATVYDPHDGAHDTSSGDANSLYTQGITWLGSDNGDHFSFYQIYGNIPGGQGKANGLGELEMLCPEAPIEIGNRVWADANHDGIQDAGEAGLANVKVQLLSKTTVIATATTDSAGTYYFSSAAGTSTTNKIYGLSQLAPNTDYTIKVPSDITVNGESYQLTNPMRGKSLLLDSNALATGEVPVEATELPMSGANNETFDIGYIPINTDVALTKTVDKPKAKRGETVSYTLEVSNTGPSIANNIEITDELPNGLIYSMPPYTASQGNFNANTGKWSVGTVNVNAKATLTLNMIVK